MLHQLSPICGMVYRTDRFERGVGQRQEIRVFGKQLHPKPCMIGGCPEAAQQPPHHGNHTREQTLHAQIVCRLLAVLTWSNSSAHGVQ